MPSAESRGPTDPIADALAENERYAREFTLDKRDLPAPPRKRLAIVSCMDARIRVHAILGLEEGDAHVIRNAGGVVTDDTIRSLAISQRRLDTRAVMVVQHTRCGMQGLDESEFVDELRSDAGRAPEWDVGAFDQLEESVRDGVRRIASSEFIPFTDDVRGFVYDVESGRLSEVR
ncbi:MAG: carbonic anhydrase [Thermoleophilales bacterium]|jgi:carbonic anhydrase|nr:carbonic anhydrase [Thermoleophilales bacterium]